MNTQKQAMSKIAQIQKEELSTQRVELATTMKDIIDSIDVLEKDLVAGREFVKDFDLQVGLALKEAKSKIAQYIKDAPFINSGDRQEGRIREIIAQGKELGVDMSKNNDVQRLRARISESKEMIKQVDRLKKAAESQLKKL
jgi:hypothetical protein